MNHHESGQAVGQDSADQAATVERSAGRIHRPEVNRRRFIGTLGASAALFALSGYRFGAARSTNDAGLASSPVAPTSPVGKWSAVPTITFTEGMPASFSVALYFSDTAAVGILKNAAELPAGVTYDVATKSLVYDGTGPVSFTNGHVLTAIKT